MSASHGSPIEYCSKHAIWTTKLVGCNACEREALNKKTLTSTRAAEMTALAAVELERDFYVKLLERIMSIAAIGSEGHGPTLELGIYEKDYFTPAEWQALGELVDE